MNKILKSIDFWLVVPYVLILVLSYVVILSGNPALAHQQLFFDVIGLVIVLVVGQFDVGSIRRGRWLIYFIILGLLILVSFLSENIRGSRRWIDIGYFSLQPSEFAKISIVILLSHFLGRLESKQISFKHIIVSFLMILPTIILVFKQPDLGTAMTVLALWVGLLFSSGLNIFILGLLSGFGVLSLPVVWRFMQDYQKERITVFLNPQSDPLGAGYNVLQAIIAVGSGGLVGRGFGRGTQSHLRFLPEQHTDFIFATFSEEWGLLGVTILFLLYAWLLGKILRIAMNAGSRFEMLLALGIAYLLIFHIVVNVGMNLGIMPVTGIPLPFMSYGGSATLSLSLGLGMIHRLALKNKK